MVMFLFLVAHMYSGECPNSYWQCYSVLWDDEGTDQLSPWDLEPLPSPDAGEEEEGREGEGRDCGCGVGR